MHIYDSDCFSLDFLLLLSTPKIMIFFILKIIICAFFPSNKIGLYIKGGATVGPITISPHLQKIHFNII